MNENDRAFVYVEGAAESLAASPLADVRGYWTLYVADFDPQHGPLKQLFGKCFSFSAFL